MILQNVFVIVYSVCIHTIYMYKIYQQIDLKAVLHCSSRSTTSICKPADLQIKSSQELGTSKNPSKNGGL